LKRGKAVDDITCVFDGLGDDDINAIWQYLRQI